MRKLRIARLEKADGFSVSYPEADLPVIRIVRNPEGFDWDPWIARGWRDPYCYVYGRTRAQVERKVRQRLFEMYLANLEKGHEVAV